MFGTDPWGLPVQLPPPHAPALDLRLSPGLSLGLGVLGWDSEILSVSWVSPFRTSVDLILLTRELRIVSLCL